jgi:hypothetical protein
MQGFIKNDDSRGYVENVHLGQHKPICEPSVEPAVSRTMISGRETTWCPHEEGSNSSEPLLDCHLQFAGDSNRSQGLITGNANRAFQFGRKTHVFEQHALEEPKGY